MRISDWSSDVCSSDLIVNRNAHQAAILRLQRRLAELVRVHFTQPLVPLHMQSAARFAEQPGKGFIKARHALAALPTTHLQSIGLQSVDAGAQRRDPLVRSEEHTSELQSLMRISYAVFCLKKNTQHTLLHHKK